MSDTAEIKVKRKKSNGGGKKNRNQDDLTGNEPLIIVSSNEKIDDGNVLIDSINHQEEATTIAQLADSDVESTASSVVASEQMSTADDDEEEDEEDVSVVSQAPRKAGRPSELPFQEILSELDAVNLLDEEKLHELKEAFTLFDLDQDGVLGEWDLKNTFLTFGNEVSEQFVARMLEETDGPMNFDAFVKLIGYKSIELDSEEELVAAMSYWDPEGTGLLCEEELKNRLMSQGDYFSEHEAFIALEEAPIAKGTGYGFQCEGPAMIEYREFCKLLCGLKKPAKSQQTDE